MAIRVEPSEWLAVCSVCKAELHLASREEAETWGIDHTAERHPDE